MSGVSRERQQSRFGDQTFTVPKVPGVETSIAIDILIAEEPGFGLALLQYNAEERAKNQEQGNMLKRFRRSIGSALKKLKPPGDATIYDFSETQFPGGGLGGFSSNFVSKPETSEPLNNSFAPHVRK